MTNHEITDEQILIDFALGRCDEHQARTVADRLAGDEAFATRHRNVVNTLAALGTLPETDPPADLVQRTMEQIRQRRQTDALLAREGLSTPARRATFSLREIGALATIAAVLVCVLLPVVHRASQVTQAGQCAVRTGRIGSSLTQFANDNDDRLPAAGKGRNWLGDSEEGGTSAALFKLLAGDYAKAETFRCPAGSPDDLGEFELRADMIRFPSADTVGFSYQHTFAANELRRSDPAVASVADSMAILADQSPAFDQAQPRQNARPARSANSLNHDATGQNVLYLDMHVAWVKTPDAGVMGNNIYLIEGIDVYNGDEIPVGPTDTFLLPAYTEP